MTKEETFSMAGLYRIAQKEGVESSLIWLMNKLKTVSSNLPKEMDAEQAKRKLIKIIAGVIMQEIEEMKVTYPLKNVRKNSIKRLGLAILMA